MPITTGFYDSGIGNAVYDVGTVTLTYSTVDTNTPITYIGANGCGGGACEHWPTWITEATTGVTQTTWTNWNNNVTVIYQSPPVEVYQPTPAQLEELRVAEERVRVQYQERDRQAKAADKRARELLRSMLNEAQRESLRELKYFDIVGQSGKRYRIREGSHGNVRLIENHKEVASFCGQPNDVPIADMMLAQKLQLEADEEEFLRRANRRAA